MSSFFKHRVNKDKIKASFEITVKKITHLSEYNGKPVCLSWKRGKRPANAGTLLAVMVDNGEAVWPDGKIVVSVTLFKDTSADKFDEKPLLLQLSQGGKVIHKLKLDLGGVAKSDGATIIEFPFEKKKAQAPSLHVLISARWLKLNDRLLVRLEDGPGVDVTSNGHATRGAVEIDGHAYNLRTDDALTEPSVDTTSGSWEEEDEAKDNNEQDPFTSANLVEAETRKFEDALESMRKQLRLVEGQSSERSKTIELQEKEIHTLRGKVVENEELVQRAMSMEGFMDQQLALLRQEHEEALRQLKQQHSKELEAELDRHREELETALTRAQLCLLSPSLPKNNLTTQELDSIKIERDEAIQHRDNLQQKVLLVTQELEESAKSLVAFDERISKKDAKIARLKDEVASLYISLNNVTESNQVLKQTAKYEHSSNELSSDERELPRVAKPPKPLFANPVVDKYWGLIYLVSFACALVLHHLISAVYVHNGNT